MQVYNREWQQKNRSKKTGNFLKHKRPNITKEPDQGTYESKADKLFFDLLSRALKRLLLENKPIPKIRGEHGDDNRDSGKIRER